MELKKQQMDVKRQNKKILWKIILLYPLQFINYIYIFDKIKI